MMALSTGTAAVGSPHTIGVAADTPAVNVPRTMALSAGTAAVGAPHTIGVVTGTTAVNAPHNGCC